jgi:hypothetical protein
MDRKRVREAIREIAGRHGVQIIERDGRRHYVFQGTPSHGKTRAQDQAAGGSTPAVGDFKDFIAGDVIFECENEWVGDNSAGGLSELITRPHSMPQDSKA